MKVNSCKDELVRGFFSLASQKKTAVADLIASLREHLEDKENLITRLRKEMAGKDTVIASLMDQQTIRTSLEDRTNKKGTAGKKKKSLEAKKDAHIANLNEQIVHLENTIANMLEEQQDAKPQKWIDVQSKL